jgi:hypothetical protein
MTAGEKLTRLDQKKQACHTHGEEFERSPGRWGRLSRLLLCGHAAGAATVVVDRRRSIVRPARVEGESGRMPAKEEGMELNYKL